MPKQVMIQEPETSNNSLEHLMSETAGMPNMTARVPANKESTFSEQFAMIPSAGTLHLTISWVL